MHLYLEAQRWAAAGCGTDTRCTTESQAPPARDVLVSAARLLELRELGAAALGAPRHARDVLMEQRLEEKKTGEKSGARR